MWPFVVVQKETEHFSTRPRLGPCNRDGYLMGSLMRKQPGRTFEGCHDNPVWKGRVETNGVVGRFFYFYFSVCVWQPMKLMPAERWIIWIEAERRDVCREKSWNLRNSCSLCEFILFYLFFIAFLEFCLWRILLLILFITLVNIVFIPVFKHLWLLYLSTI